MSVDIPAVAGQVATFDEMVMKYMPFLFGFAKFTPIGGEATLAQPLIMEVLTVLDNAARAVAAGNTAGGVAAVIGAVENHLTPGQPNSPILAGPGSATVTVSASTDASQVGSG